MKQAEKTLLFTAFELFNIHLYKNNLLTGNTVHPTLSLLMHKALKAKHFDNDVLLFSRCNVRRENPLLLEFSV